MRYFAANLDRIMTLNGVRNAWLAEQVGVHREIVGQWRQGIRQPLPEDIARICAALEISNEEFSQKPLFATQLRKIMRDQRISSSALADHMAVMMDDVEGWLAGTKVLLRNDVAALQRVFGCNYSDIMGFPEYLLLAAWAKREQISITMAKDLFQLGLLSGVVRTTYSVLVPAALKAPDGTKKLVTITKLRPRWGIAGWLNLGERLAAAMQKAGITDAVMAKELGVNSDTVYQWRKGLRTPEEDKLPIFAEVCKCKLEDIIGMVSKAA